MVWLKSCDENVEELSYMLWSCKMLWLKSCNVRVRSCNIIVEEL